MQTPHMTAYPVTASPPIAGVDDSLPKVLPQDRRAEVVYRSLTLAAMLLLLASLWVF